MEHENKSAFSWWSAGLAVLFLALVFQGSRGLWEPDEGFYANVAEGMVRTGNWWLPRLNGELFLDKPPLLYWGMALGVKFLGLNEWGMRLANAFWFVATALITGRLAQSMWRRPVGPMAAVMYAMTLAPFAAANVVTPDTVLTFCVTATYGGYWLAVSPGSRRRVLAGWFLAGTAAGLGLLAKGPAMCMFATPLAIHLVWTHGIRVLLKWEVQASAGLALLIGAAWYAPICAGIPGATSYILDNQVVGRLVSGHYGRNPDTFGGLRVYLPMLLGGFLPWSAVLFVRLHRWPGTLRQLYFLNRSAVRLLALWIVLPLIVLMISSSRLPLYALPLLPALVLVLAGAAMAPRRAGRILAFCLVWSLALVGLKFAGSVWHDDDDTRRIALHLEDTAVSTETPIMVVDQKKNALPVYGYRNVTWARGWAPPYPYFSPPTDLSTALAVLSTEHPTQFVVFIPEMRRDDLDRELPPGLDRCEGHNGDEFVLYRCPNTPVEQDRLPRYAAGRTAPQPILISRQPGGRPSRDLRQAEPLQGEHGSRPALSLAGRSASGERFGLPHSDPMQSVRVTKLKDGG